MSKDLDAAEGLALTPIRQHVQLLRTIPGVGDLTARILAAEIGAGTKRFPDAAHLISRVGLCPRNDESTGKRRRTHVRKDGAWLKTALATAAWAAVRTKSSYLCAQFNRIKVRRGSKKAIIAVAASMLTAAWHMLRNMRGVSRSQCRLFESARHAEHGQATAKTPHGSWLQVPSYGPRAPIACAVERPR